MIYNFPDRVCVSVVLQSFGANIFLFSDSYLSFNFLPKKSKSVPVEFVVCFTRLLLPAVADFHQLFDLKCDKRIRA